LLPFPLTHSAIVIIKPVVSVCYFSSYFVVVLPPCTYFFYSRCRDCLFPLDHTQTHTTVGRTPLDEGSARRRDLYLKTHTLHKTNIHAPGGIRTHAPSKRSAADLRLRPRGHWDRQKQYRYRPGQARRVPGG
jgi:hypothetical protein